MGPADELVDLLREIRDQQRELGVFLKAWKEESDRRYQDWQVRGDERYEEGRKEHREWKEETARDREVATAQQAEWAASTARSREWYELQLISYKRFDRIRPYALAFFLLILVLLLVGIYFNPGGGKRVTPDQPAASHR